jgi:hypothetical protein
MKKIFLAILLCWFTGIFICAFSQCTPVNCLNLLPPYGGVCNTSVQNGKVNLEYYDFVSFHITTACVDAGMFDSTYSGIGAKMLKLHSFKYSGLPAGLTMANNKTEYDAPSNGCAAISGTPSESGLFKVKLSAMVNVRTWLISTSCSGILTLDLKSQPFDGSFSLHIIPDAHFNGPDSVCCTNDPPVALIPTGTTGGIFSGPGVTGNIFNPSLAGPGTHQIKYEVMAQQGGAVGPAIGSSVMTVTVSAAKTWFADSDGDGFGNPLVNVRGCVKPAGFVNDSLDCNDSNLSINPGATEIPENGIDENCDGSDGKPSAIHVVSGGRYKIYPNPASDHLVVECPAMSKHAEIGIYAVMGQLIVKQTLLEPITEVIVKTLPSGVYLVILTDDTGSAVTRMVKK